MFVNWREVLSLYAGIKSLPSGFRVLGRRGFSIPVYEPTDIQTVWVVFCGKDYWVPPGTKTVLDLGANIGAFSIFAAMIGGATKIWAYEPVRQTYERLQYTIGENKLQDRIASVNKGVAAVSGTRQIWLGCASPHSSMYRRHSGAWESGDDEAIQVCSLGDIFEATAMDEIDVVKMDCEGGEVEAILNADDDALQRMRRVSMEYHFPSNLSTPQELISKFNSAGFRVVRHCPKERLLWLERIGRR